MTHTLVNSFDYEQADVPPGMTLQAWRAARTKPARAGVARRVRGRLRPVAPPRLHHA
jgi:hypothetical protein